jgi:hypothetical protein
MAVSPWAMNVPPAVVHVSAYGAVPPETVALALDPFPRGPNAAAALAAAGVISEDEFRPANAFSDLKARMTEKG